jgi:hypothetical protein
MIWFPKINSQAFKEWLISIGSPNIISPAKPLDPFGSSLRKLNKLHAWLIEIKNTGTVARGQQRSIDQARSDLAGAKLLQPGSFNISALGNLAIQDFEKYNIPPDDADFEVHRSLIIIKHALNLKVTQYQNYFAYWNEIRQRFTYKHLIDTPEHLYFFSYFNKSVNNYNPYDVIRGLKLKDADFPTPVNWTEIKKFYNDPNLDAAVDNLADKIEGFVSRQGRTNFVAAMEILLHPENTNQTIDDLSIDIAKKETLKQITKDFLRMQPSTLNRILYGPPGTGKTHNAINHALSIITGEDVDELASKQAADPRERVNAKKRFDELVTAGQVHFVTFHQSYSYEDFVEGIKSVVNAKGDIEYRVENGIFKRLCLEAGKRSSHLLEFEDAYDQLVDEISTAGGKLTLKTPVHNRPFDLKINTSGSCVAIPQTGNSTEMIITQTNLKSYVEQGVIKDWKSYTLAIGEYLKEKYINQSATVDNSDKRYVLIIDEINRGNISKIFGELITVIEKSKRLGEIEALKVSLAYSGGDGQETFGVPNNLYIVGTMNSADKSIALVDTALRRRFEFIEYPSDSSILLDDVEGIDLRQLLDVMNSRIEVLLDREHSIGHAYLVNVTTKEQLGEVFRNRIVPLLEEYFFGDYEKIQLVLGDNPEFGKSADMKVVQASSDHGQRDLFGKHVEGFESKIVYKLNLWLEDRDYENLTPAFFKAIYTKTEPT